MVPLPRTFMLTSILGLLVTTVYTAYGRLPLKWGVAFDTVFAIMLVASVISITPKWLENKAPKQSSPANKAKKPARKKSKK